MSKDVIGPKWEFDSVNHWILSDDHNSVLAYGLGDTPEEAWLDYWTQVSEILESLKKRIAKYGDGPDKERERAVRSYVRGCIERAIGLPREDLEGENGSDDRA